MRKNSYIVVCNEFLLCYMVWNFMTCTEDNFDTVTGIAIFIRQSRLKKGGGEDFVTLSKIEATHAQ